jgi:SH3-like domain-containing protein
MPAAPAPPAPPPEPIIGADSKLKLPRFMSLNNDPVNMREGPGRTDELIWIYHRRDLPVEVLRERDGWRLVRDPENVRGWINGIALSAKRTFVVQGADRILRSRSDDTAPPVAVLKPGVVGRVRGCVAASLWCEAESQGYRGYLKRDEIWGVGPDEAVN